MMCSKLPRTDSIQELARFWDAHDLMDFQDEWEEVSEPAFGGGGSVRVPLKARESKASRRIAESKGFSQVELVRQWVVRDLERKAGNVR
jgi:hypothetical protein